MNATRITDRPITMKMFDLAKKYSKEPTAHLREQIRLGQAAMQHAPTPRAEKDIRLILELLNLALELQQDGSIVAIVSKPGTTEAAATAAADKVVEAINDLD